MRTSLKTSYINREKHESIIDSLNDNISLLKHKNLRQYRTKIVRQMRRQIFRQMKQKAE